MIPPPGPPPYALYDRDGRCWLGGDDGVKTWDDWEIACAAATIVTEQLGRLIRPTHYDGSAKKFKDEVPTRKTPLEALVAVEGGKFPGHP